MRTKKVRRGILAALLALAIVLMLSITTICGGTGGKKKMENVNQSKEIRSLTPQIYYIGEPFSALSLFAVPQDNAVGTNDYKNAITVISFPRGKMEIDNYFKGAVENVRGSGTYLPVIGSNTIGFGQERRFLLYNFKE